MTVALITPTLGYVDDRCAYEVLTEGPQFIVKRHPQRSGRLWHRPRSGYRVLREWEPDRLSTVWTLWCGTSAHGDHVETSDVPPVGEPVCAACEGHAAAMGVIPGPTDYRTRFTPYGTVAPRWCPGSGPSGLWVQAGLNVARCAVCGITAATRCTGGPYNLNVGIIRHHPARDLLDVACPLHAWRHLQLTPDGGLGCRCGQTLAAPP